MADDRDFAGYVLARWTGVVRTLVLLGLPPGQAHDVASDVLSRCHDRWSEHDGGADPDLEVYDALLERAREEDADPPARPLGDIDAELTADLDELARPAREALALDVGGGLTAEQVTALVGSAVPPGALTTRAREALGGVPVAEPPLAAMLAASRGRRRRRTWTGVAVAAALVAAVALGLATTGGGDEEAAGDDVLPDARSTAYENPSPLAWHAGSTFYLPQSQVDVADVRDFAELGTGAVYLDLRGRLVGLREDGGRDLLAEIGDSGTFAVSRDQRTLAWIESDTWRLVGHDLLAGEQLLELPVAAAGARVVAVADGRAYYTTGTESYAVDLHDGSESALRLPELLDVVGGTRAYRAGHGTVAVRGGPADGLRVPGAVAALDDRGRYLLVRAEAPGSPYTLHDLARGRSRPLTVSAATRVVAAGFGPGDTLVLLVAAEGARTGEVRTCEVTAPTCPLVAIFPAGGAPPRLGR